MNSKFNEYYFKLMNIHWDIKAIADSPEQAETIFNSLVKLLSLNVITHEIKSYNKFDTPLYQLTIESLHDDQTSLDDIAVLFKRLGEPIYEDWRYANQCYIYEAIFDSRKELARHPDVFWVLVYAEKPIKPHSE